ncbi:kunitz-type protease inhibitor 2 [Polymixia lowei]
MTAVCFGGAGSWSRSRSWLLVALLVQVSSGQVCDWDWTMDSEQGLDPASFDAGARRLSVLREVKDMEHCQKACCVRPDCHLALIGTPADGSPECHLVDCLSDGKDVCVLQPDHQFKVYRKKTKEDQRSPAETVPKKYHAVPLSAEKKNSTNPDHCRRPMRVGSCRASFPRFYYDVTNQSCRRFIYGGCEANQNNFATQEECEAACSGVTGSVLPDDSASKAVRRMAPLPVDDPSQPSQSDESMLRSSPDADPTDETVSTTQVSLPEMSATEFAERCEAEPKAGPCRASFKHWYYDSTTRTCQSFMYGGCRGNKNNYETEEACMTACTVTVLPSSRKGPAKVASPAPGDQVAKEYKEHCSADSDPGPCRAAFPMFYFQPSSGTCQTFIYGGCHGNKNRYVTLEDCMSRCTGTQGRFEEGGHAKRRDRWTPAFFLVGTVAVISALLLTGLILIALRRSKLPRRPSSISDKEELLQEPDEQSSVESMSVQGSPVTVKP